MSEIDPVDEKLDELRAATDAVEPPAGFEQATWSRVVAGSRRPSRWLALIAAAAAALASFVVAWSSDATLAEQVLTLGDDAAVEAP